MLCKYLLHYERLQPRNTGAFSPSRKLPGSFAESVPSPWLFQIDQRHRLSPELCLVPCYFSRHSHSCFSPPVPTRVERLDSFTLKLKTFPKTPLAYFLESAFHLSWLIQPVTQPGVSSPQGFLAGNMRGAGDIVFHPTPSQSWLFLSKRPDLLYHVKRQNCCFPPDTGSPY